MAKKEVMNLIQFQKTFQTEEACHRHLVKMKWPEGFRCPKCKHDKAYEITTRKLPLFECVNCRHQTTVIAGTIFEKTRTDLVKWFWAIFLIAHDKRGVSATYLSEELGLPIRPHGRSSIKSGKPWASVILNTHWLELLNSMTLFSERPRKAGNAGAARNKLPFS